ncbi:GDP-mannose 4,6-dehydratase [candidate division WOR-3 bacterium]|nr:GDP-mannose 4,6-dehydratase [candidate division WOR-3 bacterium]
MKFLVTGGAGFIGSHLVDRLIRNGNQVSIIDNLSTGKETNINKNAKFYKLGIEETQVEEVFKKENPDCIFHLAAQSQVKKSIDEPILDATTNILGTLNLLALSLKYSAIGGKIKKFVFASSGGVMYGNTLKPAVEEKTPNPISPYGISKLTGEQYIKFYGTQYGLSYSILRYSNVYGPRQDPYGEAGVVSIFTNHMLKNEECILYGFGEPIRDYINVVDVVQANILAISSSNNQILNIGTGIPASVNQLFELMKIITGYSLKPIYQPLRKGELNKNFLNSNKAQKLLDWKPKVSLKDGIEQTINWFKKNIGSVK